MGNYSRTVDDRNNKGLSSMTDSPKCQVCNDRKYILVATRSLNQSSTVYERQVCQACAEAENTPSAERNNLAPQSGKKTLSGTGYLRNKKRRRKEAS